MGNPKGFLEIKRKSAGYRRVNERINNYSEVEQTLNEQDRKEQASRCMDCGVPFCQWGCPVMNNMPEWQDALYKGNWKEAIDILHETNNFPEFTGRICPAPCEDACTLSINDEPVTIRENEFSAAEKGFASGYIKPCPAKYKTNKSVAIIGSGPAGLACADLLNKLGHNVTVFEKDDAAGGLLRYGIPDFKLNKKIIDRRLDILIKEGLNIKLNTHAGIDITGKELINNYDAICIAIGSMKPRDLKIDNRNLKGIHFAMDFLLQQNKIISGVNIPENKLISARDKNVIVIGGGDTGSDCVGTCVRQGAKSITQLEILPKPPEERSPDNPWPFRANILRTSSSHEEGCERKWAISTTRFIGDNGCVKQIETVEVKWINENGKMIMVEKPETRQKLDAELVLLSMGFLHPLHEGLADELRLDYDQKGNIKINEKFRTNNPKVFAAGDAELGASLVVKAINSGRSAAVSINEYIIHQQR
jgi:glutamate synthase (NADPH/NADH) small chain